MSIEFINPPSAPPSAGGYRQLAIVESEGGTSSDVARITVFLTEKPEGSRKIGEANDKYFPNGQPAMSWIYVAGLFRPDVKVEIEAIAAVD